MAEIGRLAVNTLDVIGDDTRCCRTTSRASQTVYHYFRRWEREGIWAKVHHTLVMADRERVGREASPSAAILDSQTVRTADQKGDARALTPERRPAAASGTS